MVKMKYILLIFVVLIFVGGRSFAQQYLEKSEEKVTDKTTNWQTYRNKQYGFETKYPLLKQCKFLETSKGDFSFGGIELSVLDSKGLNLTNYINRFLNNKTKYNKWAIETKENTAVAGTKAVKVTYRFGETNRYGEITFVKNKGNIYAIGYTAGAFTCDEPEILPIMISTFKFNKTIG